MTLTPVLGVLSCASNSPQRGIPYSEQAQLAVVALIDGDFLAALPQDDPSAVYTAFAPTSVALQPDQMLVAVDGGSGRIVGLSLDPGQLRRVYTAPLTVREPRTLRTDGIGNIYAADGSARLVHVIDSRFRPVGEIVPPYDALGLVQGRVSGIAFGPMGDLYLSDPVNARIYRFDASSRFLLSFTGGEEAGWGQLLQPEGLACSSDGAELYVCDAGRGQITVFDPSGLPIRSFGGTDLKEPWAVATGNYGQIFVADRKGKTICVFDAQDRLLDRIEGPPNGSMAWLGPSDVVTRDSTLIVVDPPAGLIAIMRLTSSVR